MAVCNDLRLGGTLSASGIAGGLTSREEGRFWDKVSFTASCWLWTASCNSWGYGKLKLRQRTLTAHRLAWELMRGPIPEGLTIDHLCKVKRCVNPNHLEPVTMRENLMRSDNWAARQAAQTHCSKGHPLSGDNLARWGKTGYRFCRICHRERTRTWRAQHGGV